MSLLLILTGETNSSGPTGVAVSDSVTRGDGVTITDGVSNDGVEDGVND
jgi:hypothetical protein